MPYERSDFSAGELSPLIYANKNVARVQSGVVSCVNMFPTVQGSLVKRQGSEYLSYAPKPNERARIVPFKFNIFQQYALVFQNEKMYVMKDGGLVIQTPLDYLADKSLLRLEGNSVDNLWIDYSQATPPAHLLADGQLIFVRGTPSTINDFITNKLLQVEVIDTVTIRLLDLWGDPLNPTTISTTSGGIGVPYDLVYEIDSPFKEEELFDGDLDYDQSADQIFFVHPNHRPQVLTRGLDHDEWTFTNFSASPLQEAVAGLALSTDGGGPIKPTGLLEIKYGVTAVNDDTGEESLVAELVVLATDEPTRLDPGPDDPITFNWTYDSGAQVYRVYRAISGIYGLLGEARFVSGSTVEYEDLGDNVPLLEIGPPIRVKNEFDTVGNFPRSVALFQQRLWFGGTNNEVTGVYSTRSGSYSSYALEEITVDSSPIETVIASQGVQAVRHLIVAGDLLIMTEEGEWTFEKGDSTAISPSSGLKHENEWGSAKVKPLTVGKSALFVEGSGRSIRDLTYSLQANGFDGLDLSAAADHLFVDREVVDWCYARRPYRLCFMVMSDGTALSLTYDREQEAFGWAQHNTSGSYESCASLREGSTDNIYVTVLRKEVITDVSYRTIERINMAEVRDIDSNRQLDCWASRPVEASLITEDVTALLTDSYDSYRLKIQMTSGTPRTYWPFKFKQLAHSEANENLPEVLKGSFVLVPGIDSPGLYDVHRWEGGHPTFSTLATDAGNMTTYPVIIKPLPTNRQRNLYAGMNSSLEIAYGTPVFSLADRPQFLPIVNGRRGTERPYVLADKEVKILTNYAARDEDNFTNDDKGYASMLVGYKFASWAETLPIDPVEESASGLNIATHYITLRVHDTGDFYYARANQDQPASPVTAMDKLKGYDALTGLLKSATIVDALLSKWDTETGVRIISDDPFPLTLQGVKVGTEASGE